MKNDEQKLLEFIDRYWLTPREYSQMFNIPLRTLHWRMEKGKISFVDFKGKRLIRNSRINLKELQSIV